MGEFLFIGGEPFYLYPESDLSQQMTKILCAKNKLLFIGTAFGDDQTVVNRFLATDFAKLFEVTHLSLFCTHKDWRRSFNDTDIIVVPGGATRSMVAVWREWGIAEMICHAVRRGASVVGISAGAICWFDHYITDSDADKLSLEKGFGIFRGIAVAHAEKMLARHQSGVSKIPLEILNNGTFFGESELKIYRLI